MSKMPISKNWYKILIIKTRKIGEKNEETQKQADTSENEEHEQKNKNHHNA